MLDFLIARFSKLYPSHPRQLAELVSVHRQLAELVSLRFEFGTSPLAPIAALRGERAGALS